MTPKYHWYLLSFKWPEGSATGLNSVYMPCERNRVTKRRIDDAVRGAGQDPNAVHIESVSYLGRMTRKEFLEDDGK